MEYIKGAFASIMDNKTRALLTMLGIIIGIASVNTILAIGAGMKASIGGELDTMQSGAITITIDTKKTDKTLSGSEVRAIGEEVPEAYGATPSVTAYADASARTKVTASVKGGNENIARDNKDRVTRGRFFNESEAETGANVAVLTQVDSLILFGTTESVGMTFDMNISGITKEVRVIGLFPSKEKDLERTRKNLGNDESAFIDVVVPYTLLTQSFNCSGEKITSFKIYPRPGEQDAMVLRTKRITENKMGLRGQKAVNVKSFASQLETFNKILNIVTWVVAFIAAISLIVGGIGVMNIMTVSVTERTREIGIRKSLGARTSSILAQFLAESAMLTLIGGIIGMLAGLGLTAIVGKFMSFPPKVEVSDVLLVVGISISIGLFFGIYPALRAAKMNPIDALRYE